MADEFSLDVMNVRQPDAVDVDVSAIPKATVTPAPPPVKETGAPVQGEATSKSTSPQENFKEGIDYSAGAGPGGPDPNSYKAGIDYKDVDPGIADTAAVVGQTTLGTALETSGMLAGARIGFLTSAAIPIVGARVVGTLGGAIIGALSAGEAKRGLAQFTLPGTDIPLTYDNINKLHPDLQTAAIMTENVVGGMTVAGYIRRLAKGGAGQFRNNFTGKLLDNIMSFARSDAKGFLGMSRFTTVELGSSFSAGIGGAVASHYTDGHWAARLGGEVVAGTVTAGKIAALVYDPIRKSITRLIAKVRPSMQKAEVVDMLQQMVEDAGEDPLALAAMLDSVDLAGLGDTTAAAKLGGGVFARLEALLVSVDSNFSHQAKEAYALNFSNLDRMMRLLRTAGVNTASLKEAADLQSEMFKKTFDDLLASAVSRAQVDASKVSKLGVIDRAAVSVKAKSIIDEVLSRAREAETELWEAVDGDVMIDMSDMLEEARILGQRLLKTENLPNHIMSVVRPLLKGVTKWETKPQWTRTTVASPFVTMKDAIRARSRWLQLARDASASTSQGSTDLATWYGHMAESVLDSMDTTFGSQAAAVGRSADAYTTARNFSREFHEATTRTFVGDVTKKTARGSLAIQPEMMMHRALAAGGDASALRMRQLSDATDFLDDQKHIEIADTHELVQGMADVQQNLIRILTTSSKYVDVDTGVIDARGIKKFIADNPDLMRRFPAIKADLDEAVGSAEKLTYLNRYISHPEDLPNAESMGARNIKEYQEVAKIDNAANAVGQAVVSTNPEAKLARLVELADAGGYQAREGLRAAALDHAFTKASRAFGELDMNELRQVLFQPLSPGSEKSMMSVLVDAKIMEVADEKRILTLLDETDRLKAVQATDPRSGLEEIASPPGDRIISAVSRGVGSTGLTWLARKLGMRGSGPSLIIAGEGAKAAERLMERVPAGKNRQLLIDLMLDKTALAAAMRQPRTKKEAITWNMQLHAFLIRSMLIPIDAARREAMGEAEIEKESGLPNRQGQ